MLQREELKLLELTHIELRVLLAMRLLAETDGTVEAGMDDITDYTGYGRTSISKAVAGLESAGFINITRTKRNLGKLSYNRYLLLPGSSPRTSTADKGNIVKSVKVANDNKELKTSSLIKGEGPEEETVVNRWKNEDDLGGFGLLDEPKKLETIKKVPSTRHQRPKESWTPGDVASEFAAQLYSRIRGIPGLINISRLAPVLGKYRKEYGTTALYELQVLDVMLNDARKLALVKKEPHNAWKMFLRLLTTEGAKIVQETVVNEDREDVLSASDGKVFDNSIPGRLALKEHEEKLRRN